MKITDLIIKEGKEELRCGYTTGSCAAAAAAAAAFRLFSGRQTEWVTIRMPGGILLDIPVEDTRVENEKVTCYVKKYSGDDPDVTDGMLIGASVCCKKEPGVSIEGGTGIGRITRPGLEQPAGQAAINSVPQKMIEEAVLKICDEYGVGEGISVVLTAPEGEQIAKKTFNPRLGIAGGISILGTTGIVMPMSEKALIDTIRLDVKMHIQTGNDCIMAVPGNYGVRFMKRMYGIREEDLVLCSNFVGETIDAAVEYHASGLLLTGHIGKFVKLSAGIMNTHSKVADGRMEILAAHAALSGADNAVIKKIMSCVSTDEALEFLQPETFRMAVVQSITDKAAEYIDGRSGGNLETGIMIYSDRWGLLGQSRNVTSLLAKTGKMRANR